MKTILKDILGLQGFYLIIATFLLSNSRVRLGPSHSCVGLAAGAAAPVLVQQVAAGLAVLSSLPGGETGGRGAHLGSQGVFIN